jgi:hypothetical protein
MNRRFGEHIASILVSHAGFLIDLLLRPEDGGEITLWNFDWP